MDTAKPNRTATVPIRLRMASLTAGALVALLLASSCAVPIAAYAGPSGKVGGAPPKGGSESGGATGLEQAAKDASQTGEKVAMSLIGLALAIAAIILTFRRDFKEAAGVLTIGVVAIFLADKGIGVKVLSETVEKLFKAS